MEKPIDQTKVPITEIFTIHDKIIPIPDYIIPYTTSRDDSNSRMLNRKTIWMSIEKCLYIQIQFTDPLLKQ